MTISPIGNASTSTTTLNSIQMAKNLIRAPNAQLNINSKTTAIKTIPKGNPIAQIGRKTDNTSTIKLTGTTSNQGGNESQQVIVPRIVAASSMHPRGQNQQTLRAISTPIRSTTASITGAVPVKSALTPRTQKSAQRNLIVLTNQNAAENAAGQTITARPKNQTNQPPALSRLSTPKLVHAASPAGKLTLSSMGKSKTQPVINRSEMVTPNKTPIRPPSLGMTSIRKRAIQSVATNNAAVSTSISNLIGSNAVSITHVKRKRTADKPGESTPSASNVSYCNIQFK